MFKRLFIVTNCEQITLCMENGVLNKTGNQNVDDVTERFVKAVQNRNVKRPCSKLDIVSMYMIQTKVAPIAYVSIPNDLDLITNTHLFHQILQKIRRIDPVNYLRV